jgi:hypothetical protein
VTSERPGGSHRAGQSHLDVITSPDPVFPDGDQEWFFPVPQMGTSRDVAEQRSGMQRIFQADQWREALTVERQLTESATVGLGVSGQIEGSRQQCLGFRKGLARMQPQTLGPIGTDGDRGSLGLPGKKDQLRASKRGLLAPQSLNGPLREPDAQHPWHGRSPTPQRRLPGRPGDTTRQPAPVWFPPDPQPAV